MCIFVLFKNEVRKQVMFYFTFFFIFILYNTSTSCNLDLCVDKSSRLCCNSSSKEWFFACNVSNCWKRKSNMNIIIIFSFDLKKSLLLLWQKRVLKKNCAHKSTKTTEQILMFFRFRKSKHFKAMHQFSIFLFCPISHHKSNYTIWVIYNSLFQI